MTDVLARKDRALTPEETEALLRDRLGDQIASTTVEFGTFTVHVAPSGWHAAAQLCRDEPLLAYDMFDCLFGIDAREDGFDVVVVLYSTSTGNRICLRTRCDGGRDEPVCATITDVYRGADWMERETYDMFGIDFPGHPGLEPRILTVENFEGWPLRKDFHLTSRVAKPWPGVKEPAELDEDGNVIERVPGVGDAPGPYDLDKAMAEQARAINQPEEIEVEADPAEVPETTSSTDDEAADEPPPADIDQETYDRLISEGKSERIARSKAKAAFIKKQRAAEKAGDDATAAEAAPATPKPDAEDAEEVDRSASAEVEAVEEAAGASPEDEEPTAAEKAEARRKEQAEARRRKAEERAAEAGDAAASPDSNGEDQDADADEEGQR